MSVAYAEALQSRATVGCRCPPGDRAAMNESPQMRRLQAYLDASPIRRRLRLAILIVLFGASCWLWVPAGLPAWKAAWYKSITQSEANIECPQSAQIGFLKVDRDSTCGPSSNADDVNAYRQTSAWASVRDDLGAPLGLSFVIVILSVTAWTLVPLLDRR